ncbi:ribokinase [Natranaerobius thermophilus]|uniref:Ribokinase n=1 Tax=Natranaerobius thermophilus (strain ATCC BAA-1301 / DSM 18059 / JW/NM-WN-LF) TaxID=457570 RepID=B2A2D8_NATTJ|nr:ribokinase [Natranaerobius thermophilus]ACB86244.1 ribokinase [Natranaerobius thermophilus JW/NM-WN-LF]
MSVKFTVMGSLNMDFVLSVPRLPQEGETLLAQNFSTFPGGKGANQAVALARLGGQVNMIGAVGDDDLGNNLLRNLEQEQIDTTGVQCLADTPTGNAFITVDQQGKNTILVYPGANGELKTSWVPQHKELIQNSEYLLMQLETPLEVVEATAELADSLGTKVILNPAPGQELSQNLLKRVHLLTPNETELSVISGMTTETREEQIAAARHLTDLGVDQVVVTLGSEGAFHVDKNMGQQGTHGHHNTHCNHGTRGTYGTRGTHGTQDSQNPQEATFVDSFSVKAVDTTAAGDSFTAALAIALGQGQSIENALKYASAVAAITVTKEGAQSSLPYSHQVDTFLKKGEL